MQIFAGIDIGGTKIYTLLCNAQGTILAESKTKTPEDKNPKQVIDQTATQILNLLKKDQISTASLAGVGVGFAGLVNFESGIVESSVIFPLWNHVPLREILSERFSVKVTVDNDANAAAFGEWWLGAGQNTENLLCLTLGTGIGGGIIIGRQLYRGSSCTAGEFGHMTLVQDGPICWCGNAGCTNPLASGTAIASVAKSAIEQGVPSRLSELKDTEEITAQIVAQAANLGDPLAQKIIDSSAVHIGVLLASLINAINPDCIVLTGSLIKIGSYYLDCITREAARRSFAVPYHHVKIVPGHFGEASGALGAAGILLHTGK